MEYELEQVNCPFCDSGNYRIYLQKVEELYNNTREKFDIVECRDCGFIFTNPRPTRQTISFFYPDSAGYYQPPVSVPKWDDSFKETLLRAILAHFYNYGFKTVIPKPAAYLLKKALQRKINLAHIPRFVKNGDLLDIGSSWGLYLSRMAAYGWKVWGVELNKNAAEYARTTLNSADIFNGSFDDYDCRENFFDVVHMNMVLEHLHDPVECLNRVYKILKKGGQLIISVPDISGFEAKLYGKCAYMLHVPQHLCHFSPETIRNLMAKTGFSIQKIIHHNFDRDFVASSQYLEKKWPGKILANRFIRTLVVKPFVFGLGVLGRTSRMSVYATK
jgi:2-polyprenyl-3-methyl-5-hydroxy-6-metoxy-1,4-benzoquinol methylase